MIPSATLELALSLAQQAAAPCAVKINFRGSSLPYAAEISLDGSRLHIRVKQDNALLAAASEALGEAARTAILAALAAAGVACRPVLLRSGKVWRVTGYGHGAQFYTNGRYAELELG
jgi:hypothetical protein